MNFKLVFEHGDWILITVFLSLIAMSITTWIIILMRIIRLIQAQRGNRKILPLIWSVQNLQAAIQHAKDIPSPMSDLTLKSVSAYDNYHSRQGKLATSIPFNEYLIQHIRNSMEQIMRQFDGGLTALASIGATAPFIGLFGTVWGIYHALINISQSGQMSIAAVAGPIGEALVATAAGLFVAIPAVLAYNALSRGNKNISRDMDNFAHDLYAQLLNHQD